MMKKMWKKGMCVMVIGVMLTIAGCGTAVSGNATETAEASEEGGVTTIRVAAMGTYAPFVYENEDGELDGYEMAVVRALDELMTDVEFEYIMTDWNSLLPGLDSNRWDMCASNIAYSEERDEGYLPSDMPYCGEGVKVLTNTDHSDWTGIADATGKCVVTAGSAQAIWLEDYLTEHEGQFELVYIEGTPEQFLDQVSMGSMDFTVDVPPVAFNKCEALGIDNIIEVGENLISYDLRFWFRETDDGQAMSDMIAPYLEELVNNGTISALSEEYLGYDCLETMQEAGYWTE